MKKGDSDLGAELGELCPQAHEVGIGRLVLLRPCDLHLDVLDPLDDTHGGGYSKKARALFKNPKASIF